MQAIRHLLESKGKPAVYVSAPPSSSGELAHLCNAVAQFLKVERDEYFYMKGSINANRLKALGKYLAQSHTLLLVLTRDTLNCPPVLMELYAAILLGIPIVSITLGEQAPARASQGKDVTGATEDDDNPSVRFDPLTGSFVHTHDTAMEVLLSPDFSHRMDVANPGALAFLRHRGFDTEHMGQTLCYFISQQLAPIPFQMSWPVARRTAAVEFIAKVVKTHASEAFAAKQRLALPPDPESTTAQATVLTTTPGPYLHGKSAVLAVTEGTRSGNRELDFFKTMMGMAPYSPDMSREQKLVWCQTSYDAYKAAFMMRDTNLVKLCCCYYTSLPLLLECVERYPTAAMCWTVTCCLPTLVSGCLCAGVCCCYPCAAPCGCFSEVAPWEPEIDCLPTCVLWWGRCLNPASEGARPE